MYGKNGMVRMNDSSSVVLRGSASFSGSQNVRCLHGMWALVVDREEVDKIPILKNIIANRMNSYNSKPSLGAMV